MRVCVFVCVRVCVCVCGGGPAGMMINFLSGFSFGIFTKWCPPPCPYGALSLSIATRIRLCKWGPPPCPYQS